MSGSVVFFGSRFAVNLVSHRPASTTLKASRTVRATLDPRRYDTGTREEFAHPRSTRAKLDGNWNYSIKPRRNNL